MGYSEDLAIEKRPKMRCNWASKSPSYFLPVPRTETLEPEQVVGVDVGQRASRGTGRFMWQTLDHGRVIR